MEHGAQPISNIFSSLCALARIQVLSVRWQIRLECRPWAEKTGDLLEEVQKKNEKGVVLSDEALTLYCNIPR